MKSIYGTMYYVKDMKKSVTFFTKTLGIKPSHESDEWTEFSIGGHNLCLHATGKGTTPTENGILIFSADKIKKLFDTMKGDGLDVFNLHEVHPAAWTFHMRDKDKNEFSFFGKP